MFSANGCFCSSINSQILFLLSPTQTIFFTWCVLNLNPVNRSTVSLGNELFLCRIGERWVLGWWRGHPGAFIIWKYRRAQILLFIISFATFSSIKGVRGSFLVDTTGYIWKMQTPAASGTTTYLEKAKREMFCHCCHGLMWTLYYDFVIEGGGKKDHSFLWAHSHKSVIPLVPLGMFYPISLAVSAGKATTVCLIYCFVHIIYININ